VLCHRVNRLWVLCSAEWKGEVGPAFPSAVLSLGSIYRPSYMTQLFVCPGSHALTRSPAAVGQLAEKSKLNFTLAKMINFFSGRDLLDRSLIIVSNEGALHSFCDQRTQSSEFQSSISTHDSGVEPYKLWPSFEGVLVMSRAEILLY
jgi:hypothetical protein